MGSAGRNKNDQVSALTKELGRKEKGKEEWKEDTTEKESVPYYHVTQAPSTVVRVHDGVKLCHCGHGSVR